MKLSKEEAIKFLLRYDNEYYTPAARQAHRMGAEALAADTVLLPCKIGDVVWGIKKYNHNGRRVKQGIVQQMYFGDEMQLCISVKNVCRGIWGKNIFATKEEAEAALAKMDGDGNA